MNGEIAPTIPIGIRSVSASFPAPAADASIGITSPASLRASTAAKVKVDTARCASTRAAFIGLPASARDDARGLVVAFLEQLRRPVEDPGALVRRQRRLQRAIGGVERPARLVGAAGGDPADQFARVGGEDVRPLAGLDLPAVDQQCVIAGARRHL